jgi:ankyrin repeat protein
MHVNLNKMLIVILALTVVSSTISCTSHHKPHKPGGPMLSLHIAAIHYPSRIDERIDAGENVNNTNHMFGTPLMAAVRFGKTESVAALLARNANPNIPDSIGHLPLAFAARVTNMKEIVKLLVKYGADINAKGYYGRTALHYTAKNGDLRQASFLLENGADLNLRGDVFGFSPLFCAVNSQKPQMVEFLLAHGASVSLTDDSENTVMDIARHKNPKIVRLLEISQVIEN